MKLILATYISIIFVCLQSCTSETKDVSRPKDTWAFRSVLDRKPRMLTLALDTSCYAAYDLANCRLYKVWKGGVNLQGAAFTDKKNVQPISWGTSYSDSLHNTWRVELNGIADSFKIQNRGYRFSGNQVYIKYLLIPSTNDSIIIEERPEFKIDENGRPVFERMFTSTPFNSSIKISLASPNDNFSLKSNGASLLSSTFNPLPPQHFVEEKGEYDHRGRYFMEKSDCFTCHEMETKTVGPSFHQIATRYKTEEAASRRLIEKVKNGGSGVWGTAAMNPHPQHSETEVRVMVDYILSLDPAPASSPVPSALKIQNTASAPGFGAPLEAIHPSYDVQTIHKYNFKPRVGGLAFTTSGDLLVSTWDSIGGVYLMKGVETGDTNKITVKRIATGLAEPLGIEVVDGSIYVLQKQELTKLIDNDNDEVIDEYEVVCNSWEVTGDFHEFAFGLVHRDGFFYATLSMAMRLMSHEKQKPDRGRTIKIAKDGSYEWINYGMRTPNGIGMGPDDQLFVTDNQGEWVPANKLVHVKKGEYHGMRWGHLDSTKEVPPVALPAIWLPEDEIGNSPSEPVLIKDGVYKGQMLHGDVTYGGIQRDFLEKINGNFQGAVFRFSQGLEAGVNRMRFGNDGALYIGGVGMVGGWSWKEKQFGLQRMVYNGQPVFDMLAIRLKPDGFEIEFTEPVSQHANISSKNIGLSQWWYLPTADYGGPKKDLQKLTVSELSFSADRKKIFLKVKGLKDQRVVYFQLPKIESEGGRELWSGDAWYTLNSFAN